LIEGTAVEEFFILVK